MKSRTSFFNGTAFKKDLTRFAPLWGLYTLCLMLGLFLLAGNGLNYDLPNNLAQCIQVMAVINLGYALLAAQVLFGDLYNARMCNVLHALPLRRECWFGTHIVSGLFMSIVPTALMTVVALILMSFSSTVNGWQLPLYWMLGTNLEYIFFFGVAVFSALCTGNRVAMAVVYAILNFASIIAYYMVGVLYIPMLHGVILQAAPYLLLCPVAEIVGNGGFINCTSHSEFVRYSAEGYKVFDNYLTFAPTGKWWYLWVIAAIGAVLIGIAFVMYRRRKLECAGDFMATKKLEPVFMVLFSLTAGCVFQVVYQGYFGSYYGTTGGLVLFLFIGLAVGWFIGRMLLERKVQVFRRGKSWLGLAALALVLGASLLVTKMDVFGIEDWIPEADQVAKACLGQYTRSEYEPWTEDPEEIEKILRIHELAAEKKLTEEEARADLDAAYAEYEEATREVAEDGTVRNDYTKAELRAYARYTRIVISYELKNGRTVQREYYIMIDSEEAELVRQRFSRMDYVFDDYLAKGETLMDRAEEPVEFRVEGLSVDAEYMTEEAIRELFRAVMADCEAGTMTQDRNFHSEPVLDAGDNTLYCYWIRLQSANYGLSFDVYADAENTLAWLESTGILDRVAEEIVDWDY